MTEQITEEVAEKEKNAIANNMLKENIDIDIISRVTGLSLSQIKELEN